MDLATIYNLLVVFFGKALFVIGALFPILNPPGHAPIFLALTRYETQEERILLARKIAINCFLLMVMSMLLGGYVLKMFGISLSAVEVGGGLLVMALAWEMMFGNSESTLREKEENAASMSRAEVLTERAFYPLSFPITVGPGTITIAITIAANFHSQMIDVPTTATTITATVVGLVFICATIYWCYGYADKILSLFGKNGANVFFRLSAFILMCLGVQIIWQGMTHMVSAYLAELQSIGI